MQTLIYILQAHLLFLILGGLYHFALRNERSFTFNRIYLLAIYGVSVTAPLLDFKLFKNITFLNPSLLNTGEAAATSNNGLNSIQTSLLDFDILLPSLYGILVFLSIIVFAIKFMKSYYHFNLLHRSSRFDYKRKVYWVEDDVPPFTFLNKTIIPEKLKMDENCDVIIMHEQAHRKTLHFIDIIFIEILSSILVFNPLNKKIKKYVAENHEFLADDYACKDRQKASYAQLLIQQSLNQKQLQFVSYFAKPTILNRLHMLQNNKKSTGKPFIVAIAFIAISLVFSCDFSTEEEIVLKPKVNNPSNQLQSNNDQVDENTIFNIVEEQAEPKEGIQAFYDNISDQLKGNYPQAAAKQGIEGVVYIQFIIEKNGGLSNIQAVKGIGGGCDEVAVEALKNNGEWIPGKQNGKAVRSRRVIPIRFVM